MPIDQRNANPSKMNEAPKQMAEAFKETAEVGQQATDAMTGNAQRVSQIGGILANGFRKISSEWMHLAQSRFQMNLEGFSRLLACKSPQDLVAAQSDLVRQNMEKILSASHRIAELSMEISNEAAGEIRTTTTTETTSHMHHRQAA